MSPPFNPSFPAEPGDIVQIRPAHAWGYCLVTVDEIREWGIIGMLRDPGRGDCPIKLDWDDIKPTGGKAIWSETL